jgi:hypothetical protein
MAIDIYGHGKPDPPSDDSDLWGINPNTGRLYKVKERRESLRSRGKLGFQNVLPSATWDEFADRQAESNYAATGKTPAELSEGAKQQYGGSMLSRPSIAALNPDYMKSDYQREVEGRAQAEAVRNKKTRTQASPETGSLEALRSLLQRGY